MIVMFLWQKFPMGLTTMTCCALLAAFGIPTPAEAFGGFTNNSIILMTTIMSNNATQNILYTVAATVALAGNWDPRGIMLIIAIGNIISLGFPSGAAETALIYAAGNYSVKDVWKFTVPYILIAIVTIAVSANMFFPIYGK